MNRKAYCILTVAAVLLCAIIFTPEDSVYAVAKFGQATDPHSSGVCKSQTFELLTPDTIPSDGAIGEAGGTARPKKVKRADGEEGTDTYIPLLAIVMGFDGTGGKPEPAEGDLLPYDLDYDWSTTFYDGSTSLKQYYTDMSFGKFTFEPAAESSEYGKDGNLNSYDKINDGIIHVTLDRAKTKGWAVEDTVDENIDMAACFLDALDKADEYIDFSEYDSNEDGAIQTSELALCFIAAGRDYASVPSPQDEEIENDDLYIYTWPHAYSFEKLMFTAHSVLDGIPEIDGVAINDYIIIAEDQFEDYKDGVVTYTQEGIGTLAHELGHYIGLPDLYDTGRGLGDWNDFSCSYLSLMDFGNYGKDMEGHDRPFSIDIFCRTKLGWVEPVDADEQPYLTWIMGGSLDDTMDFPAAARLNTSREKEYYLIENRRFTSWDEGLSLIYTKAAVDNGEDRGGGLIFWHIDEAMYDRYFNANNVNNYTHHPSVIPAFREKKDGKTTFIGTRVLGDNPFFTPETWDEESTGFIKLPLYKETGNAADKPSERIQSKDLILHLGDSGGSSEIIVHRHDIDLEYLSLDLSDDGSSVTLSGRCSWCFDKIDDIDTTDDFEIEVITRPTFAETGVGMITAHFKTDGFETVTCEAELPPLGQDELDARNAALAELRERIIDAKSTLAEGRYTDESAQALKEAIGEANALFDDDSATTQDVRAAEAKILEAWRLLEIKDTSADDEKQAWRDAVSDLAETLVRIYSTIDPEAYKPSAYAAFTAKTDAAYTLLEADDSSTDELLDMKTDIMREWTSLEKNGRRISIGKAQVSGLAPVTYNGKAHKPKPVVTLDGMNLSEGTDYSVSYSGNINAGSAVVAITGIGDYKGAATGGFKIGKAANTLAAKARKATVKYGKLKKKNQTLAAAKVITLTNKGQGAVTYKLAGVTKSKFRKYFKIDQKTGKVTIKKGLQKGTYKVNVKVKAAGNANYEKAAKTVTFNIKIK